VAVKRVSHKPISLTSESLELMRAVEQAACAVGAATTLDDVDTAYSVLNTARDRMARRLERLEKEAACAPAFRATPVVQVKFL
jgi:hypothetical protein